MSTSTVPVQSRRIGARERAAPTAGAEDYKAYYRLSPAERVEVVNAGVPATLVEVTAHWLGQPKERLAKLLGLSLATVNRKAARGEALSAEQGERLLGIAEIIGLVQTMVEQSGDPAGFDAAAWVAHWLESPLPALGGRMPEEYLNTRTGQELIVDLLRRAQSGAYS